MPLLPLLRRPAIRRISLAAAILLLSFGGWLGFVQLSGNFAAVVPGVLYRSAQPSDTALQEAVQRYGIRTVINLRGANPKSVWYRDEVAESKRLGLEHRDFKMSADTELPQKQAEKLIALMRDAPKPVLIHCAGGADRSGLAAALYLAAVQMSGEEAAEAQMSVRYGHLAVPFAQSWPMDRSFEALEPWLGYTDS